jgi:cellulose synthase/poly-beta-1,6-N-acetylglucosamine synthase-like glycosyltransferase
MVIQTKHAWKAQKVSNTIVEQMVPNTIEKQAIVIYVAMSSQGMSWKVHSKFAYGHIKTHPYSICKNENGLFFVKFFCNNTWTFRIKFFSHNIIFPWFLVHNTFILFYLQLWFCAILSSSWHCDKWPRCNFLLCMLI